MLVVAVPSLHDERELSGKPFPVDQGTALIIRQRDQLTVYPPQESFRLHAEPKRGAILRLVCQTTRPSPIPAPSLTGW